MPALRSSLPGEYRADCRVVPARAVAGRGHLRLVERERDCVS